MSEQGAGLRVVVTGGREFTDRAAIWRALDRVHRERGVALLISGMARGADRLAVHWAESCGVPVLPFPVTKAEWDDIGRPGAIVRRRPGTGTLYDAGAGFVRNQRMLDEGRPDVCVAFPGGDGTADMKTRVVRAGVPMWEPCGDKAARPQGGR